MANCKTGSVTLFVAGKVYIFVFISNLYIYIYIYIYIYLDIYINMNTCIYIYMYMYVFVSNLYIYIYTYIYIHIYMYIYMHICTYTHVYIYIRKYIYIYTYILYDHMHDMTHAYVWYDPVYVKHNSFMSRQSGAKQLFPTRDLIPSYVWHDSLTCVIKPLHIWSIHVKTKWRCETAGWVVSHAWRSHESVMSENSEGYLTQNRIWVCCPNGCISLCVAVRCMVP